MLLKRQFSILALFLLTAYVAAIVHFMREINCPLAPACISIAFWLIPIPLAALIKRRIPLAIWCSAVHVAVYVLLREAFYSSPFPASWSGARMAVSWAPSCFCWLGDVLSHYQNHLTVSDDWLNSAILGSVIFPIVGVAFSMCMRGAPGGKPILMAPNAVAQPLRRAVVRGLLTALVVVPALSPLLIWVFHERHRIAERRNLYVAADVRRVSGYRQPVWRRFLLGDDWPDYTRTMLIGGDEFTDDVLVALKLEELTFLQHLCFGGCPVTSDGFAHLTKLRQLRQLSAGFSYITDESVAHFASMKQLESLEVQCTAVSGAALARLVNLTQLRHLTVDKTQAASPGLATLRNALPGCRITVW